MGRGNRSAIGTLVERSTRFLILVHVPAAASPADAVRDGVSAALGCLPTTLRRTLDLGSTQGARTAPADHRGHRRPGVLL